MTEMLELVSTITQENEITYSPRITRCATNPDDSISRAKAVGLEPVIVRHPSSHFYNEFTLFSNID